MPQKQLRFGKGFRVTLKNAHAQAATMVLVPGDAEGGLHNRHRGSDQWLFVLSGTGRATVNGRRHSLRPGEEAHSRPLEVDQAGPVVFKAAAVDARGRTVAAWATWPCAAPR